MDWIIAGLGNPGSNYERTRHNIGWMVIDAIANKHGKSLQPGKGQWMEAEIKLRRNTVLLVKPTTYMNASGEAIIKLARLHKLPPERIIAVVDEYNFPVGKVHIKQGGSDGGHNGITSLIEELKTPNFWRLRCGIGKNFQPGGMIDYVLSNFSPDETADLEIGITRATNSIEHFIIAGAARAMSAINSGGALV
ncbi:MAG: aminoacyl-tRNA hydrolase [Bacteroidetes bacterium]|nr:aminoacyl-tRNA hydrolase [Bacteroidota bacterium]